MNSNAWFDVTFYSGGGSSLTIDSNKKISIKKKKVCKGNIYNNGSNLEESVDKQIINYFFIFIIWFHAMCCDGINKSLDLN